MDNLEKNELAEELFNSIMRLRKYSFNFRQEKTLTSQEAYVLKAINYFHHKNNHVSNEFLAENLNLSPESLSRATKHLREKGIIETLRNKEEHRRVQYEITEKGFEILKAFNVHFENVVSDIISSIGEEDCKHFIRILTKLFTTMELKSNLITNKEEVK